MEKTSHKLSLILAIIFSVLAAGFTAFVAISGPHVALPFNEFFYQLTKYLGPVPFILVAFYGFLFISQLLKRKSLKKIDRELLFLLFFYFVIFIVYILFEKVFVLNFRPVTLGGEVESSYPSSHTLFSVTLCLSAILLNKKYVAEKYAPLLNALLSILMVVIVVGRFLSGVHWLTDILGGVLFSLALVLIYSAIIKHRQKAE